MLDADENQTHSRFPSIVKHNGIPIPCSDGWVKVDKKLYEQYQGDYPTEDIVLELMKIRRWLKRNPDARPPRKVVTYMIDKWLKRTFSRG